MKFAIASVSVLLLAFAGVTYVALESGGVAIIETQQEDGTARVTSVWFAREGRELWLEAGSPRNGWFVDVKRTGELFITIVDNPFRYTTKIHVRPQARKKVRKLLREKYGWRDSWVGYFVDHAEAIPVSLHAVDGAEIPQSRMKNRLY